MLWAFFPVDLAGTWIVYRSWGNFTWLNIVHFVFEVNCDSITEVSINHKTVVPLVWGLSQLLQMLMVVPGMSCLPSCEWHHLLWKEGSCWGREDELQPPFLMVSERWAGLMWSFVGLWQKDCGVLIGSTNFKVFCFLQLHQFGYIKQFLLAFKVFFYKSGVC